MSTVEQIFYLVPAVLIAISFHEFAHGYVAHRLGDPTPEHTGRLTLNPMAHIDPIGALMLLVFRFGWAKPVMVNPTYFKNPKRGMLLVGLAGPVANVLVAWSMVLLTNLIFSVFADRSISPGLINWLRNFITFLQVGISLNLWLASFNLIPIPPLDGSKILMGILPNRYARFFIQLERYGFAILIVLLFTGIIRPLLSPIFSVLYRLVHVF